MKRLPCICVKLYILLGDWHHTGLILIKHTELREIMKDIHTCIYDDTDLFRLVMQIETAGIGNRTIAMIDDIARL